MSGRYKFIIPNLCKNSSVLIAVLVTELIAIAITAISEQGEIFEQLGAVSLYLQWCVMSSVAILCMFRTRLNKLTQLMSVSYCFAICILCYITTELSAQFVLGLVSGEGMNYPRFYANTVSAVIVTLLIMRFFTILTLLEHRSKVEMEMTIQVLQARIRPHFLFNSLNTISELAYSDPRQAEKAVDSLALLFRAGLESDKKFHSLESELSLCRGYVELEKWRLGSRLKIEWNVLLENTSIWEVPRLIMQPLIENAIIHGVDIDGNIQIDVDVRETKRHLSILIENEVGVQPATNDGNGIAVDNIRERLFVLYDDQQTFRVKASAEKYSVIMRFPKQTNHRKQ